MGKAEDQPLLHLCELKEKEHNFSFLKICKICFILVINVFLSADDIFLEEVLSNDQFWANSKSCFQYKNIALHTQASFDEAQLRNLQVKL